jgi:hypothetical protein
MYVLLKKKGRIQATKLTLLCITACNSSSHQPKYEFLVNLSETALLLSKILAEVC